MGLRRFHQYSALTEEAGALLDASELQHALESADASLRRQSIQQAQIGQAVTDVLLAHLEHETCDTVLEALMLALARSQDVSVVAPMLEIFNSENVLLRNRAIEVLLHFPEQVMEQLPRAYAESGSDAQIFLINLMMDLKHPEVLAWLIEVLQTETQPNAVAAVLEVMAEIGDATCLPALRDVQQRWGEDPFMAFAIEFAQKGCTPHE